MEWIRHTSWDGRMECAMALYHTSFPINEQRTDADHKAALEDERFYCLSAWGARISTVCCFAGR